MLTYNLETMYKLAKMEPIFQREYVIEKDGCNTEHVELELPSLVLGINLLSDVTWFAVIRTRKEATRSSNIPAMGCPEVFVLENGPVPSQLVISRANVHVATPERYEEVRYIAC